mgnify:CR=1 FL=1
MNATPRRPKLAHVAMSAGVSIGTASDALRGKGRMSEETRQRVLATAESMGYRANANARLLARGDTYIVALVIHEQLDSSDARPVYWPLVRTVFTERLFQEGIVAFTMSVDDLHKLDGLPFDLLIFAGIETPTDLPQQVRSNYRVVDIDIGGDSPISVRLRDDFDNLCAKALDRLMAEGVTQPGLLRMPHQVVPERADQVYRQWCDRKGLVPETAAVTDAARIEHMVAGGVDGLLAFAVERRRLRECLTAAHVWPGDLPVLGVGAPDRSAATDRQQPDGIDWITIDGRRVGTDLAELALGVLAGRPADAIGFSLSWLLNDEPWQP